MGKLASLKSNCMPLCEFIYAKGADPKEPFFVTLKYCMMNIL